MARPKSYRDLVAWQKAMALARQVYRPTEELPRREAYGSIDQRRRAAVSVASNVAEGYGRLSDLQFRQFLGTARGSLYEMQTQVELATDLGYLEQESGRELSEQANEVARLISGLLKALSVNSVGDASTSAGTTNSASPASPAF